MALPVSTAIYDAETNSFLPPNTGTWADLTTWGSWGRWAAAPADTFTVITSVFDRGQPGEFNIRTETDVTGNITYHVWTSTSGEFAGEETVTTCVAGATDIPAFSGQYYIVEANIAAQGGPAELREMNVSSTDLSLDLKFNNVVTANLTQTASGAVLSLPRTCSAVLNVQITLQVDLLNNFAQDFDTEFSYIEMPTFRMPQPLVTAKARTGPTFVLMDMFFGTFRQDLPNHVIDARVVVLPEQFHDGQNLATR